MKKLFFILLILSSTSYIYSGDEEPTEDKDAAWFADNYNFYRPIIEPQPNAYMTKQTVLLANECSKKNPSPANIKKYIDNGALLNTVVKRFGGTVHHGASRPIPFKNYGTSLGSPLEAAITHVEDAHVVNVCQLLIKAKANPLICSDSPECPPVRLVVKRFEQSYKSPSSLAVCESLIKLTEPHERVDGICSPAVKYAIEEINYPSVNSKALLPLLEEYAKMQPTQKSEDLRNAIKKANDESKEKPNTEEKTYNFSNAPESEEPEKLPTPNSAGFCPIL